MPREKINIVLSVLIITHNQRTLLKRCLDSVVKQKIDVAWEIVISDDRSNDGTKEMVDDFIMQNRDIVKNLVEIKYSYCNSDDCEPATTAERCGWNKLNAWKNATGKYMVNIDADDYLCNDNIYQHQIDMLETHPECSMCQQCIVIVDDGKPLDNGLVVYGADFLHSGDILNLKNISSQQLQNINQAYMMVRHPEDDVAQLYGKYYDDTVITLHHLQYGPIVFFNEAGYVWVQYPNSINNSLSSVERSVLDGILNLHHIHFFPHYAGVLLYYDLQQLIRLYKVGEDYILLESQRNYWKQADGFIFEYYSKKRRTIVDKIRYRFNRYFLLLLSRYEITSPLMLKLAYCMLTNSSQARKTQLADWKI